MNTNGNLPEPADGPAVVAVFKDYLAAWESGSRPDRRAWLERYPEVADELSEYLDGLEFIQGTAPQLWDGATASALAPREGEEAPRIGDYRILREIGRGGMGAVYEAEQVSLRRRVALKVLPFAAALDPKQLQRFQNESHAAAQLHHPNIVPIHAVGCERGVHYYAMQYIEGRSLAELLADFRREARQKTAPLEMFQRRMRRAAELVMDAARALEHAHQVGVIHRDLKPANLLVDQSGQLWVTDFGLALLHNNPALTVTGELVGTLRYMNPEQSLGRRGTVDHRTDVYSLGVTLYELLTLEPAFDGQDTRELLNQLATAEPRPPRRAQRAIPLDLETVVLKAIAKNPAERYASAQELAEDLRRFLDDEPVRARRPTLFERAGKWARRHKPLVASALTMLVLAVVVLGGGIIWMTRERSATKTALQCARRQASAAREQHARAEESFRQARAVVDYFTRVSAEELAGMPPLVQGVRRRMLETALLYYQNFLNERRDDPSLQAELEGCRARASKILEELYALEATGKVLLAAEPAVQADLQVSEAQRDHLRQLADRAAQQAHDALVGRASPEEMAEGRGDPLAEILTPEQARRLDQITLQKRMVYGACDPHVVEELHLTTQQQAEIRAIQQDVRLSLWASIHHDGLPGARHEAPHEFWKATSEKVLEVLNDDQKTAWKQMIGEPFKGRARSSND